MKKLLKQQAGRIDGLCEPQDREAATLGFESEIAKLRSEVASFTANRSTAPPLDAPVLISLNRACEITTLSRTAINRWRSLGLFPAAVPLGDKRVAFVREEVEAWIRDRVAERDQAPLGDIHTERPLATGHAAASNRFQGKSGDSRMRPPPGNASTSCRHNAIQAADRQTSIPMPKWQPPHSARDMSDAERARWCLDHGAGRLSREERGFLFFVSKLSCPLKAKQRQQLSDLHERLSRRT